MGKNKNLYYEVEYASGMFRDKNRQNCTIVSNTTLKIGEFIIVEHVGSGIFIGKVLKDISSEISCVCDNDECLYDEGTGYKFIQKVDLSKYLDKLNKEKRKAELEEQMRDRFTVIDEIKKFEYYATLDDDMAKMYEEYKKLS